MSLRLRLSLLLTGVVVCTALLSWGVTGRLILGPFIRDVFSIYLDEVLYVAQRVEAGQDREALGAQLGLDIQVRNEPPFRPEHGGQWARRKCVEEVREGRVLRWCRGRRAPVAVQVENGWVVVRRDVDFHPRGRFAWAFVLVAALVVGLAVVLASALVRPLAATQKAMARIATGDLDHRLPQSGPKELVEAASAFNTMAERIGEMLRAERALMAGISHELRTPLARLRLELELLREVKNPEGTASDGHLQQPVAPFPAARLDSMEKDLEEVDHLIAELLESSRLSLGERKLDPSPIDLGTIATEAQERASQKARVLLTTVNPAVVSADRERLVRVVSNLIENALKYSPAESPIEIQVDGRSLAVLDRGPGVPPASLERVFEPFYRAPLAGRSGVAGYGLGLWIAEQIVKLHGGNIRAENRPGGGFSVRFELPA